MTPEIAEGMLGKLIDINISYVDMNEIICIDINSLLSPLSYRTVLQQIVAEMSYGETIQAVLQIIGNTFISKLSHKKVIFYAKNQLNPNHVLRGIYGNWRRANDKDITHPFYRRLLKGVYEALNAVKNGMIEFRLTELDEHGWTPRDIANEYRGRKIMIISRDTIGYLCCMVDNVSLWNGTYYYSKNDVVKPQVKLELYNIHPVLLPMAIMIGGSGRLGYVGLYKNGHKKAMDLILKYNLSMGVESLENITDNPKLKLQLLEMWDKYKPLFYYDEYKKYIRGGIEL